MAITQTPEVEGDAPGTKAQEEGKLLLIQRISPFFRIQPPVSLNSGSAAF